MKKSIKNLKKYFSTLISASMFIAFQNNYITVSKYEIFSRKIPKHFDGMKILQISDLQRASFGKENIKLLKKTALQKSDIIVITGDLVDCRKTDFKSAIAFAERLTHICQVYFVCGNHDWKTGEYAYLRRELLNLGIHVLDDKSVYIDREKKLSFTGVMDIEATTRKHAEKFVIKEIQNRKDSFNIVLSHRPELFDAYVESGADLVLSGHAHGGQIRLPFLGGLFAPNQGFFPKYTNGMYKSAKTCMIVSRGLGNSRFPVRIFNFPEITVTTLKNKE